MTMELFTNSYLLLFITLLSLSTSVNSVDNDNTNHNQFDNNQIENNILKHGNGISSHELIEYHLEAIAQLMSSSMRRIANEELGVITLKHFIDGNDHVDIVENSLSNYQLIVEDMVKKVNAKLESASSLLMSTANRVEELFQLHLRHGNVSSVRSCCDETLAAIVAYDRHFNTEVTRATVCDSGSLLTRGAFSPGTNLSDVFRKNLEDDPSIRWQYFISTLGVHSEFPAAYSSYTHSHCYLNNNNDLNEIQGSRPTPLPINEVPLDEVLQRHRDVYLATVLPRRKHVLIMIDRGSALTPNQLTIAKSIGKFILNSLSHTDSVGVISFASDVHYPQSDECLKQHMANANFETKFHLSRFIDSVQRSNDPTNHVLGLQSAFRIFNSSRADRDRDRDRDDDAIDDETLIVYISRGLLFSLTDAKAVMELMSREMSDSPVPVVINCYVLIDDTKPVMYETVFLKDLAEMNYKKYHVKGPDNSKVKPGIMVTINSSDHLGFTLSGIYSVLSQNHHLHHHHTIAKNDSLIYYSLPFWDPISRDLQVSISRSVHHRGKLIGVVGLDISLSYLTQEVIYYSKSTNKNSYAFMIEKSAGTVIQHPTFGRPSHIHEQPMHTDISHLEQYTDFESIKRSILLQNQGSDTITLPMKQYDATNIKFLTYYWKHITQSPYVLVIGVSHDENENKKDHHHHHVMMSDGKMKKSFHHSDDNHFVYHRLDLALASAKHPRLCRHLKQLATLETATLFLSGSGFQSPYNYLHQEETTQLIQRYMAYLNDNTKLIANPGLKPYVRDDVHLLSRILPIWIERLDSSSMSKFIVRKYVSTCDVMLMYPGALIERNYEPSRRDWYQRAVEHVNEVMLTGPYLDVGGAGFIVTLSYAIPHFSADTSMAVMAMDLTLGYFHKFLLEAMPICGEKQMSCFLMDDRGYLLAHPSLVEASGRGPLEQKHITHKEPLVANDLLNQKHFVSKRVCNRFNDRTIQRYYTFNTSINGLLTNMVHGEQCAKYQIAALPETNAFVGIVNQTCEAVTAFCPCSMTDRLCLNCHRLEQTDCECPCECPLEMDICSGQLPIKDLHQNCPPIGEQSRPAPVDRSLLDSLHSCYEMKCHNKNTDLDCLGVLGCEWCHLDSDGVTHLSHSFCHYQKRCFGGILGAATPYADEIIDGLQADDYPNFGSAPVGPVAGGIMACFIMLALSVYCYRYHSSRQSPHFITSLADPHMRHTHFNNDLEDDPHEELSPAAMAPPANVVVLASFENAAGVSPYRMNPAYRRPGGDSDHGYSTMTPHEADSELAGPAYIEPLLIARDKQRLKLANSTHSETENENACSSRDSSPMPSMTLLPKGVHVPLTNAKLPLLAQVQVHVVDANG